VVNRSHHRPVLRSLMALTAGSILVAAVAAPRSHGAAQDRDESEIRAVQARQAEAWNRHDATAYADLFEEDGDVVNVVGWWWAGRAEIESKLTAMASLKAARELGAGPVRIACPSYGCRGSTMRCK